jgi:hypothetical protein
MTADSPEEAGMLMQMLKLAGVQQVTPDMIGAEEPTADNDADHDHDGDGQQDHAPQDCNVCAGDDAIGSQGMGQVRDIVTAPDDEKAEETFANEPDEKVSDVDTLVNVHSGGLNKQKQQVRKEYPGDNPLASKYETVEDKISEEDLANSLRNQYEGFKKDYQEAAKVAEAKEEVLDEVNESFKVGDKVKFVDKGGAHFDKKGKVIRDHGDGSYSVEILFPSGRTLTLNNVKNKDIVKEEVLDEASPTIAKVKDIADKK